jgi:hypothetical protein
MKICDRCGEPANSIHEIKTTSIFSSLLIVHRFDICKKCNIDFKMWVENFKK